MKTRILKSVSALTSAIMLTLTLSPASVSGQEASGQDERGGQVQESAERSARAARIEGLWDSRVTARNCQTGDPIITFRGLAMFIGDGSLTATNSAPPATNGPALGRWRYLGGQHYTATFRFFPFTPDGSFTVRQDGPLLRATASRRHACPRTQTLAAH